MPNRIQQEQFVAAVRERGGFDTIDAAERATTATLRALGRRLHEPDADAVAEDLPGSLADALRTSTFAGEFEPDELYARVAAHEGMPLGLALEHAQVVCQVLGESLGDTGWKHLNAHLPEAWRALFAPPSRPSGAPAVDRSGTRAVPPGHGGTLASGRPGSRHPVSEATAPGVQRGSVAASDSGSHDPHADRKVSSAGGTAGEQRGETLARGRPHSKHPVSEAGDE